MAFKASRTRKRKTQSVAEGKPLVASAAIRDWYSSQIKSLIDDMIEDYRSEITKLMAAPGVEQHYAADAKLPIGRFKKLFERLFDKWFGKVSTFIGKTASSCAVKIDQHSFSSVGASLKSMGIKEPRNMSKADWETQIGLYVNENIALIKSIAGDFHSGIEKATWNSLTSEIGEEQGAYGIQKYIYKHTPALKERSEFIARDQNSKLNSVLNNARMEQNGVDCFIWLHSSAGKVPRQCHIDWNGRTFLTKGGPSELYELLDDGTVVQVTVGYDGARKGDIGKPGYCINCKCRARPKLIFRPQNDD